MELKRKNNDNRENKVMYYGEGSPYTPYTPGYNAGGAVQINLSDIFPGTGLEGVYSPSNWSNAWNAFKNDLKAIYNAMSSTFHKTYKTAKQWFKSFFGL